MPVSQELPDNEQPSLVRRMLLRVSPVRAAASAILLAGLFGLLAYLLLSRGESARLVDTPAGAGDASPGIHTGDLARDFEALSLRDVESQNLDNDRVRLSDLRGQPLVINFWATWCPSCLAEMPALEMQRRQHEDEGLQILAVNVGEDRETARAFIERLELFDFTIALDPDLTVADAYGVRGLPYSLFIDSDGVIQAEYRGQLDDETMQRYVQAAIKAAPGAEPESRLRLVTTVPRVHVLDVQLDEEAANRVLFTSRRFRCDDSYCAGPIQERVLAIEGVTEASLASEAAAPSLAVTFDAALIDFDTVVAAVADALRAVEDPLYTRELQIRLPDG